MPVKALKPRLQLRLPHPIQQRLCFQIYCTSLSLLSVSCALGLSTPTPSSWLNYYHYVGIPKCEGRVFRFSGG